MAFENQDSRLDAVEADIVALQADVAGKQNTLSDANIKTKYENNADTNAFTDALKTKLNGIEAGATADQSNAEIETAYNAQVSEATQDEAEAGTSSTVRRWTAERIKQLVAAFTHSGDVIGSTTLTIANNAVTTAKVNNDAITNAKLANVATATIKGRSTAGTGDPEDLTAAQVRTIINVADGAQVNPSIVSKADAEAGASITVYSWTPQRVKQAIDALAPTLSIGAGSIETSHLANDSVENNKLADMVANRIKGRITSDGNPQDLTAAQVLTILGLTGHGTHTGDVTGSTTLTIANNAVTVGKIAANAVTTAKINPGAVDNTVLSNMTNFTIKGRHTAGTGDPEDLTPAQAREVIGAQRSIHFNYATATTDYIEYTNSTNSYTKVCSFIFEGTDFYGSEPTSIKLLVSASASGGGRGYRWRIVDNNSSLVIDGPEDQDPQSTSYTIITFSSPANIDTSAAIWELQVADLVGGSIVAHTDNPRLHSISILF
jgi:hypothetical protein